MDLANCSKKISFLSAYFFTKSADTLFLVKRISSELNRPLLANKFLNLKRPQPRGGASGKFVSYNIDVECCCWSLECLHLESPFCLKVLPSLVHRTVESLADRAKMSAQDTVSGHSFSIADFISSMTSNPLAESLLGFDLFSLIIVPLLSSKIDASQPCNIILQSCISTI
ncbi:hypothetical protein Lal_00025929 [Lupinus albus]|nr:hypothetical protein Lal_00025929 [Lupinus albus]